MIKAARLRLRPPTRSQGEEPRAQRGPPVVVVGRPWWQRRFWSPQIGSAGCQAGFAGVAGDAVALICPVLTGLGGFLRPDSRWLGRASAAGGVGGRSFEANGLRPLSFAAVTHHHEPASQPLLLLMPAIYDAQAARVDAALNQADLYERLLSRFA